VIGRHKDSLEMILSGGNKGGKMDKNSGQRVEDKEEPSAVASMQIGYLDQIMRDGPQHGNNVVTGPKISDLHWDRAQGEHKQNVQAPCFFVIICNIAITLRLHAINQ
jgi:hypothetical protein